ncbi:MAG: flagellar basal body P-ring formation chaperone FlgA [Pseudomonadota bacterium]
MLKFPNTDRCNRAHQHLVLGLLFIWSPFGLAGQLQSLAQIQDAAVAKVKTLIPADTDFEVESSLLDPRLRLTRCSQALTTEIKTLGSERDRFNVRVSCHDRKPWSLFVPVEVRRYGKVVVAARALQRNQVLTQDDLTLERRRLRGSMHYFSQPQAVIDQVLTRAIPAGLALNQNALRHRRVIRRGQNVTITIQSGAITVRAQGVALTDGQRGQHIRVRNLNSKKTLNAKVMGAGQVAVVRG